MNLRQCSDGPVTKPDLDTPSVIANTSLLIGFRALSMINVSSCHHWGDAEVPQNGSFHGLQKLQRGKKQQNASCEKGVAKSQGEETASFCRK